MAINQPIFRNWQPQRDLAMPVYLQIESWIEGLIFDRVLEPHTLLPAVSELVAEWNISPLTAHKAYRRLKERGLVYAIVGSGTFVASVDSNCFVGLLIHREMLAAAVHSPTVLMQLNLLHQELAAEGLVDRLIIDNNPRRIEQRATISADAMSVLEDPALQALVAIGHDGSDELHELLQRRRIPSIGFAIGTYDFNVAIEFDRSAFFDGALDALKKHRVEDIAVMYFDDPHHLDEHRVGQLQQMDKHFSARSLRMRPEWVIGVGDFDDFGGYHAFEYLWGGARRPRGLILADDVVARSAMTAVVGRQVRVPEDLRICVWSNRNSPIVFPETWMRWEFDLRDCCRQVVAHIRGLQAGKPSPRRVKIPGRYIEEERAGRKRPARQKRVARFRTADQILSQADL